MFQIFVIMGKFASGKTTVAKLIESQGIDRIITCTTRKKREKEREGIDYFFISDDEFEKREREGRLIAVNKVYSKDGDTVKKYAIDINLIDLSDGVRICVVEPSGYYRLLEKYGKDVIKSIYLQISDKERFLRALNREISPDMKDLCDKYYEELGLYEEIEANADYIVNNNKTSSDCAEEIIKIIDDSYIGCRQ